MPNNTAAKINHPDPNFGEGNFSSIELVDDGTGNVSLRGTDANDTSSSITVEMANNGAIKIKASLATWPFVIE
jgi:hypothetical protein